MVSLLEKVLQAGDLSDAMLSTSARIEQYQ